MKGPFASRGRLTRWVVIPVGIYLLLHVIFVLEDDNSAVSLGGAWLSAGITAAYMKKARRPLWEAVLAGTWFPVMLAWGRVYWSLGLSSPASAAQSLMGAFGWRFAPSTESFVLWLLPASLLGYGLAAFDLYWERKTGLPFFRSDED